MNQRMMNIVQQLSTAQQMWTISRMAEEYKASVRTIRNDLNEINEALRQKGGGILLPEGFPAAAAELLGADFYKYKLSPEQRIEVAAAVLVNAVGYVTLSDLAEELAVSRATVINDLAGIKELIRLGGMEVKSHPSRGLMVTGKELDRRRFLLERMAVGEDARQTKVALDKVHLRACDPIVLRKILREQERKYQQTFTDPSFAWSSMRWVSSSTATSRASCWKMSSRQPTTAAIRWHRISCGMWRNIVML